MKKYIILLFAITLAACNQDSVIETEKTLEQLKVEMSFLEIGTPEADALWQEIELKISAEAVYENPTFTQAKAPGVNCLTGDGYIATDGETGDVWQFKIHNGQAYAINHGNTLGAHIYCWYYGK